MMTHMLGKIYPRYSMIGMEINDPPYLTGPWFPDPSSPLPRLHANLYNRLDKAKRGSRENSEDFNAASTISLEITELLKIGVT